jgi:hypothetical protein
MNYPVAYRDKERVRAPVSRPQLPPGIRPDGYQGRDIPDRGTQADPARYPNRYNKDGRKGPKGPNYTPGYKKGPKYPGRQRKPRPATVPGIQPKAVPKAPQPARGISRKGGQILRRILRYNQAYKVIEYLVQLPSKPAGMKLPAGWSKCKDFCNKREEAQTIGREYNQYFPGNYSTCSTSGTNGGIYCDVNQSIAGYQEMGYVYPPTVLDIVTWEKHPTLLNRGHVAGRYVKNGPYQAGSPMPQWQKGTVRVYTSPGEVTEEVIADPFMQPIGVPAATPVPLPFTVIPHREPNPDRVPSERSESGYKSPGYRVGHGTTIDVVTGLEPGAGVSPRPGAPLAPGLSPPPTVVDSAPGVQPRPGPPPAPHQAKRPGKRKKEAKLVMGLTGKIAAAVNFVTESSDLIRALHGALPPKYRAPRTTVVDPKTGKTFTVPPPPHKMAEAIYRNFDKMDWPKALKRVIENEAGDRFYGNIGQAGAKANRAASKTGVRVQIGLGPAL